MRICEINGCESKHLAKGYCFKHYARLKRTGGLFKKTHSQYCSVEGCKKRYFAKGLCCMHYTRLRNHGDVLYGSHPSICCITGCDEKYHSKGLCRRHYGRLRYDGFPDRIGQRKELTQKQAEVFAYIVSSNHSPTMREIGKHFGFSSQAAWQYIKILEKKEKIAPRPSFA